MLLPRPSILALPRSHADGGPCVHVVPWLSVAVRSVFV